MPSVFKSIQHRFQTDEIKKKQDELDLILKNPITYNCFLEHSSAFIRDKSKKQKDEKPITETGALFLIYLAIHNLGIIEERDTLEFVLYLIVQTSKDISEDFRARIITECVRVFESALITPSRKEDLTDKYKAGVIVSIVGEKYSILNQKVAVYSVPFVRYRERVILHYIQNAKICTFKEYEKSILLEHLEKVILSLFGMQLSNSSGSEIPISTGLQNTDCTLDKFKKFEMAVKKAFEEKNFTCIQNDKEFLSKALKDKMTGEIYKLELPKHSFMVKVDFLPPTNPTSSRGTSVYTQGHPTNFYKVTVNAFENTQTLYASGVQGDLKNPLVRLKRGEQIFRQIILDNPQKISTTSEASSDTKQKAGFVLDIRFLKNLLNLNKFSGNEIRLFEDHNQVMHEAAKSHNLCYELLHSNAAGANVKIAGFLASSSLTNENTKKLKRFLEAINAQKFRKKLNQNELEVIREIVPLWLTFSSILDSHINIVPFLALTYMMAEYFDFIVICGCKSAKDRTTVLMQQGIILKYLIDQRIKFGRSWQNILVQNSSLSVISEEEKAFIKSVFEGDKADLTNQSVLHYVQLLNFYNVGVKTNLAEDLLHHSYFSEVLPEIKTIAVKAKGKKVAT